MEEDIFIPTDGLTHSDDHPFCGDPTCPCHDDTELTTPVFNAWTDGELTQTEAERYMRGGNI